MARVHSIEMPSAASARQAATCGPDSKGGVLAEVKPHPEHPLGMLCTIGAHSPEIVNDPDRLRHPMKRVGEKG